MHSTACRCEACEIDVTPVRPSHRMAWKLANVAVWAFIIVVGPFLAVMPPLNLVTMPVFIFAALAMVGHVSDKLRQTPSCPRCGRDVPLAAHAPRAIPESTYAPLRNSPGVLPVQRKKAL